MDSAESIHSYRLNLVKILKHIPGAALLFALVPLLALGYLGWFYYGAQHLDRALYALRLDNITVSQQPAWISTNVLEEVFNHARLDRISLLDPNANAMIAQAFDAHNWVKFTSRVTKSAGGHVEVDLVYRRPVAMVYYESDISSTASGTPKKGMFPVDDEGIILPTQNFGSEQIYDYFLIYANEARPAGDIGMPFGDVRIQEALTLCKFLEHDRAALGLQDIVVDQKPSSTGSNPWFLRLITKDNREILWGHAPNSESIDEPKADEKRTRMIAWLNQVTPRSGPRSIDLTRFSIGRPISSSQKAGPPQ